MNNYTTLLVFLIWLAKRKGSVTLGYDQSVYPVIELLSHYCKALNIDQSTFQEDLVTKELAEFLDSFDKDTKLTYI